MVVTKGKRPAISNAKKMDGKKVRYIFKTHFRNFTMDISMLLIAYMLYNPVSQSVVTGSVC